METPFKHSIKVVARRTGLSADVIRAWERRYQAVAPQRSVTDRRLYSDEDVERLKLLRRATETGRRIGDVAQLSLQELNHLIAEDEAALEQPRTVSSRAMTEPSAACQAHVNACLTAIQRLEPSRLEAALADAAVALSIPVLLEQVISPLLRRIGELWQMGRLRPCHEHMATAQLRLFLGTLIVNNSRTDSGPAVLITTPLGQRHELGALMVAVTAVLAGWQPLYLGPDIPSDEIAFAATTKAIDVVALSISYPVDDLRLPDALRRLRRQLPERVVLLVGGSAVAGYQQVLKEIGAWELLDLQALWQALDSIRRP
jgi:DNA-binding transcriptional MerR regulator/methylmalonyl-CoA mutase cobalamin-binding subunit